MKIEILLSLYFFIFITLHAFGCTEAEDIVFVFKSDTDTQNSKTDKSLEADHRDDPEETDDQGRDTATGPSKKYNTGVDVEQNTETQTDSDSYTSLDSGPGRDIDIGSGSNNDTADETDSVLGTETEGETDTGQMIDCDLTGVWGTKFKMDATWGREGDLWDIMLDGRDEVVIYARTILESFDPETGKVVGTTRGCGVRLPAFLSTFPICEAYQPEINDQVWESPGILEMPVTATVECTGDSCIVNIDRITYFLGLSMSDIDAPFPNPAEIGNVQCDAGVGLDCFLDYDLDGEYGITANIRREGSIRRLQSYGCNGKFDFRPVPLSAKPRVIIDNDWIARADRVHIGARAHYSGKPVVSPDCQLMKGYATSDGFKTRSPSCKIQPGTRDFLEDLPAGEDKYCNTTQSRFLNGNLPNYLFLDKGEQPPANFSLPDKSPSNGGEMTLVKIGNLGDTVTCAEIRGADY